jgi:Nitronate monooxygenase
MRTPVCELLGIEQPIVLAPTVSVPRLVTPVPVIAAGGIGDARGVAAVLALRAQAAWLGTRFLLAEEMPIHEDYRRRLIAAAETDPQWYPNPYDVGWPDSPHRALRKTRRPGRGRPAGRPPDDQRPGWGHVVAHFASGEAIVRYEPSAADGRDHRGHRSALDVGRTERRARQSAAASGRHRGRADLPPVTRPAAQAAQVATSRFVRRHRNPRTPASPYAVFDMSAICSGL